jgi:hypothetical protein
MGGKVPLPPKPRAWIVVAALVALATLTGASAAQSGPDFRISSGTSSGGAAFGFGPSIGLDFRSGVLHAAWADNSISAGGDLDLASEMKGPAESLLDVDCGAGAAGEDLGGKAPRPSSSRLPNASMASGDVSWDTGRRSS